MKGPITGLFFVSCLAVAQESGFRQFTMSEQGTAYLPMVITGKPYSAKAVNRDIDTLQDGTHITHVQTALLYRDTIGRIRRDEKALTMEDLGFIVSRIDDPVAGYHYTLDNLNKVAYRIEMTQNGIPGLPMKLPRPPPNTSCVPPEKLPTIENLGTRTMEGLAVQGSRSTTIIPTGDMDNDKPLTSVREIWFSTYICGAILNHSSSPQGYDTTSELTDISTAEPDSSLFQIPPNYRVIDKSSRFEIILRAPAKQ